MSKAHTEQKKLQNTLTKQQALKQLVKSHKNAKPVSQSSNSVSKIFNKKFIYYFHQDKTDGSIKDLELLGGKGANLAEMSRLGLQVPPGFTLTTELCELCSQQDAELPEQIKEPIKKAIAQLETWTGKAFNTTSNPLLLSVRSGAACSMPGMMDTILNLGLNPNTVKALGQICNNEKFAWDTYRRFIQMYSSVVMGMNSSLLDVYIEDFKNHKKYSHDSDIQVKEWQRIVSYFKDLILQDTGLLFPEDPWEQLWNSILAVFKSWNSPRARVYRDMNSLSSCLGTAVNIQSMVFGNRGSDCATGVVFTRNPSTGENQLFGEFLINAQGEDVVAGSRTPSLIINPNSNGKKDLKQFMPDVFDQLLKLCKKLEKHYKFAQDIEFTVENNKLWLLQTRNAKCTTKAKLQILFDLESEKLITEKDILKNIDPLSLNSLLHPSLNSSEKKTLLAKALPASPGGGIGRLAFSNEKAEEFSKSAISSILVRSETSPEDISGMIHSKGILTIRGGMTSHAAVVARSMGKPCVVGCEQAYIDDNKKEIHFKNHTLKEGDEISIDGMTGEIFLGKVKTQDSHLDKNFHKLMKLTDKYSSVIVRANAETATDVQKAKEFGAKGLGLCRTEHMFFNPKRINIMRKMILSDSHEEREQVLKELFIMQKQDFYEILKIMSPYPVTIRLLDPPLHEFLPHNEKDIAHLAKELNMPKNKLQLKINCLQENNPMLGHRGCRLAITFPEIYLMQTRAVALAIIDLLKEKQKIHAEIMLPLLCSSQELITLKKQIQLEIKKIEQLYKTKLHLQIGSMIEIPRACLEADELAKHGDFISFGTNDLTQMVFGFSRDDSGKFLPEYLKQNILKEDPFSHIDTQGVGSLMKIAVQKAREVKKDIKIGVCGEHAGDPKSIKFFHQLGLDYISCSAYRVPIVRCVSAQLAISKQHN